MPQCPAAFGLYPSTRALHVAAEALRSARFRQTDISVMYSDGVRALSLRESAEAPSVADEEPESIGQVLSALSGLSAVAMPHDGPYMAAGPILSTLVGSREGLLGALTDLGIPDWAIACFQGRLREGGLLLSVQCEDLNWADRARLILQETGAEHVALGSPAWT